jgi:hypothetical protein
MSAQNVTTIPARAGPSRNFLPATCMFPLAGTTRSNSTAGFLSCSFRSTFRRQVKTSDPKILPIHPGYAGI